MTEKLTLPLSRATADIYLPRRESLESALKRVTHVGIGAHPDDLEIMAFHGIVSGLQEKGGGFAGITCTDGARSARAGALESISNEEMRIRRRAEQRRAAKVGKYVMMIQLDHSSDDVKDPLRSHRIRDDLRSLFQLMKPRNVYTHNLADRHETHVAIACHVLSVLRNLPKSRHPSLIYGCEVWRNLDWLSDDLKVALDVSGHEALAKRLLACFPSQTKGGKRYDVAAMARRTANATFHKPRTVDEMTSVIFAMDLRPLLNKTVPIAEWVSKHIDVLREDVTTKIRRFS